MVLILTHRHGDAGQEELHGVVPLLPLRLSVGVLLLSSVRDTTVQSEQGNLRGGGGLRN